MELNRLSPVYDQPLNMTVSVSGGSHHESRSIQQLLNIRILNGTSTRPNISTGSQSERLIHLEVIKSCLSFILILS
jgi:hypothetical protein